MPVLFVSFLIGTAIGISGFFAAVKTELIVDTPQITEEEVQTVTPKASVDQQVAETGILKEEHTTSVLSSESTQEVLRETETPTPTETPGVEPTETLTPTPTETLSPTPTISLTPTPTPTTKPITAPTHLEPLFQKYAAQYGADSNLLKKIADCESHFNNNAIALDGLYVGMYQFSSSSWISMRNQMGLDTNPDLRYGAEESIQTAAYALSKGKASMWPTCSK